MSISTAFSISRSGLLATSQWAELVSGNIANADRDGYGRRTLSLTGLAYGGVATGGITRESDQSLTRMFRAEFGRMTRQHAVSSGLTAYSASLGGLDDPGSPASQLTALQTSFDLLFNDPGDLATQRAVVQSAESMARGLNELSGDLDATMQETRRGISASVTEVNRLLTDMADLNRRIQLTEAGTPQRATLEDEGTDLLNKLAEYVDFQVEPGNRGSVDVFTAGGVRLVEAETATKLSFRPGDGALIAGDIEITPADRTGITGGRLAGQLELLNDTLPKMRLQLDEFARAVIETFEGADASLAPGQAGLFTDAGDPYDPARLKGLAGRIAVNDAVRPEAGGALWRVRDGIGATAPGAAGDPRQIGAFLDALDAPQGFAAETGLDTSTTLTEYMAALIADQQGARSRATEDYEAHSASAASIDAARLNAQGVNIDDELQQLLQIEQAYAANSQVVSSLKTMLDVLLNAV